jgi:putative membrane protein
MKNVGTIVGVVLLVLLVLLLLGGVGMMGFGGMGMGPGMMGGYAGYGGMMGGGYGFNPLGLILSLVLWALIISGIVLLVVWLARSANGGGSLIASSESPLDILKRRYARGEVTKEQFDAIKRDLEA